MPSPVVPPEALKHRPLWLLLGYSAAALVVFLSLGPTQRHVIAFAFGDKVEHVLAFAVPTWWFGQLHPSAKGHSRVAFVAAVAAITLEIAQQRVGGYACLEYGDMVASGVGILVGRVLLPWPPLGDAIARFDGWLSRCPARPRPITHFDRRARLEELSGRNATVRLDVASGHPRR